MSILVCLSFILFSTKNCLDFWDHHSYIESIGYFGIIPLFFSLYAIAFARRNIFVRFFTWSAVIAALLSLEGFGQILYLLHIPVITSGEGDRIFYLVYLSGAILAGFGLIEFISTKSQKRNILSLSLFCTLFILVIAGPILANHSSPASIKTFIHNIQFAILILTTFLAGTAIYLLLRKKLALTGVLFMIFIAALTYFDLYRLGYRFLTFSNKKFLYPQMSISKFIQDASKNTLARNIGLTEPELGSYLNVYTVDTYNPLYLLRTAQLLQALQGKTNEKLPTGTNKYTVTKGEKTKYALDFLGVSLFVVDKDINPSTEFFNTPKFQGDLDPVYKDDRYAVYRNTKAHPRFNVYYETQQVKDDTQALNLLSQNSLDFRRKLITQDKLPIVLQEGRGSAQLLSSTLNTQQFTVTTDKPALFYISDAYFPGWTATVNNHVTKIYRANYTFRAVMVPKGTSTVKFNYKPTNFLLAEVISTTSALFLCLLWLMPFKRRSTNA